MTPTQGSLFAADSEYETVTRALSVDAVWERVFTVAPLVIVGSKETDGTYDLAPKHMASCSSSESATSGAAVRAPP